MKYEDLSNWTKVALAIIMPVVHIAHLYKLKHLSSKTYYKWLKFIESREQVELFNALNSLQFMRSDSQRALIAQHKLPTSIYNVIKGEFTEYDDVSGIADELIKSRLEPVLLGLLNSGWVDTITFHHLYLGNGIVVTFLSNVYEIEYHTEKSSILSIYALISIVLQVISAIIALIAIC